MSLTDQNLSTSTTAPTLLKALFYEALSAVKAETCLARHLPSPDWPGKTCVIAIGKGAAEMAAIASEHFGSTLTGLVVTRYGHGVEAGRLSDGLEVIEAGHPVPDLASERAAQRALALAQSLKEGDRLIALISGGGSALLAAPAEGVTLAEKQHLTKLLLSCGASISEINCVRKHLSSIKGGRLALAAAPALVETYLISDIPGDEAHLIASGPTLGDPTSLEDARAVLEKYAIEPSPSVADALSNRANESPFPNSGLFVASKTVIIATARDALDAATNLAVEKGFQVTDLGDAIEAEAHLLGAEHGVLARQLLKEGTPRIVLCGGETSVTVTGKGGRGGRNLEYLLSLAIALDGAEGVSAIACDTDGIDGTESAAGAIVTPDTLARARALGLDAKALLASHNSYLFFEALGDLVVTGPTRTNVNDFRAIVIDPPPAN